MASLDCAAITPERIPLELGGSLRYLARQPILDVRNCVHGYELLFRSGAEAAFRGEGEQATRTMIDNTVVFGMKRLTGGLPAFVNCTAETLTGDDVYTLPSGLAVLEILESVEPTEKVVEACKRLKAEGYRLALDDFEYSKAIEPLIGLVDYIKLDFRKANVASRMRMADLLRRFRGTLVAEKVETHEEFEQAKAEGFALFQGFYFCQPLLMARRKVPANRSVHLQLLQLMGQRPLDLQRISDLVKREPAVTYRLLRMVNSPACALRQEVTSIKTALLTIGDDQFCRMALLAIASELNAKQTDEILRVAFQRARFCEMASALWGFDPTEQYLLGMFTMLPAMLQSPMKEAISDLPIRDAVREALMGNRSEIRCTVDWLEFHQRGEWESCDALAREHNIDPAMLYVFFTLAVLWADEILSAAVTVR